MSGEEREKSPPDEPTSDHAGGRIVKTIGHGTRSLAELIDIFRSEGIQRVVDVRSIPRSRHNPQFNADTLPVALATIGIDYIHMPSLGGLRRPGKDSPNGAWRNASFRGFADYMLTEEFSKAMEDLQKMICLQTVVLMCAETLPWRCHRSLIADALTANGQQVQEILGKGHRQRHNLTPWAHVEEGHVRYPFIDPLTQKPSS